MSSQSNWRARFALAVVVMLALAPVVGSASPKTTGPFGAADITGSAANMQQVALPARVARVAYMPGTSGREAWGIALSSALGPGWQVDAPAGQVLFVHYLAATGWQIHGPPRDAAGKVINPTLYALDIAPNGEGWAVGEQGVLLHHIRGGGWVKSAQPSPTAQTLHSVSLVADGATAAGFAAGEGPSIIKLHNGEWAIDTNTVVVTKDLTAISAASSENAWAISGNADKDLDVYKRTNTGWTLITTDAMFDSPPSSVGDGIIVREASGAAVAATQDGGAWIGGVLHVTNSVDPFGDELGRPFALHIDSASVTKAYCPVGFTTNGTGVSEKVICTTGGRFPAASFDLTSFSVLSNGEVFAGGLGLFHFRKGSWMREPNTNGYLISTAFASPTEGWVATTGNTYGAGGTAYSSALSLGHWTKNPEAPRMARWPQANQNTLEAVALSPDGNGDAMAVGYKSALVKYTSGRTWDRVDPKPTDKSLHGIAWPQKNSAWAVGERGAILHFDGRRWENDPSSESITEGRSLYAVAFAGDRGYAVGTGGTILRYGSSGWTVDAGSRKITKKNLYAVVATATGFIAAGDGATIIAERAGTWKVAPSTAKLVTRPGSPPPSFSMLTTLADGTVLVGGGDSALIRQAPGSSTWTSLDVPIDGTVVAAAGSADTLFVSVSRSDSKYVGDRIGAPDTIVLVKTLQGWTDIQHAGRRTIYETDDPSVPTDGIYGIVVDKGGRSGWAVGGTVVSTPDDENHSFSKPSSAVYRFDLDKDPTPPSDIVLPKIPKDATTFAFFSESACSRGSCAEALGSGQYADVISRRIQDEINTVSALPNGPKMVMFGGSARFTGHPDELSLFRSYLHNFDKPVYAAIGTKDLFTPPGAGVAGSVQQTGSFNSFWLSTFKNEPAPWGNGSHKPWIKLVDQPVPDKARTHYAFDVLDSAGGKPLYRIIVLDSSRKTQTSTEQSPNEDQSAYFQRTIAAAGALGIPTIVVMNQPTMNPYLVHATPPGFNQTQTEVGTFDTNLSSNGGRAVFQGGFPVNAYYFALDIEATGLVIPFFVSGAGGRPYEYTKVPTDGFYPAWILATVSGTGLDATVTAKAMPVLDSIALHAEDGLVAVGGNALRFDALARFPDGGFSDPDQSKARYMELPPVPTCPADGQFRRIGPQNGSCFMENSIQPDYTFSTSDPTKAMFVKWDNGRDLPAYDINGEVVPDPHSAYMCTFQSGNVDVYVTSGLRRDQAPATITGGKGPCVQEEVPPPPDKPTKPTTPPVKPKVVVPRFVHDVNNGASAIFPPIPAPVVAPAPPGAPGVGRKEEHQASHETEGHSQEGKQRSTAVVHQRQPDPVEQSWMILGSVAILSFMSATVAARGRERRLATERERSI